MKKENKKFGVLVRLTEKERFNLKLSLLKKHLTAQSFLKQVILEEIGEVDNATSAK